MTLLDFDAIDLTAPEADQTPVVRKVETVPPMTEQARAIPVSGAAHIGKETSQWGWSDLRDYIMGEIEKRHGVQVRDPKKEASIIKSFMARWGTEQAVRIARTAFDVHDGQWRGAPISITRFCKASDEWFGSVIAENF